MKLKKYFDTYMYIHNFFYITLPLENICARHHCLTMFNIINIKKIKDFKTNLLI